MAAEITCDGCPKKCGEGETFFKAGYIEPCDYCPDCRAAFETFDTERRNLAFEAGETYRQAAKRNRENFEKEHPGFNLPDRDRD